MSNNCDDFCSDYTCSGKDCEKELCLEHDDMITRQKVTWDGSIVNRYLYCSRKCFDGEKRTDVLVD